MIDYLVINTSFKWAYGGHQVFVTGTFTGWKDHIPLQKVGNDYFNAIVVRSIMILHNNLIETTKRNVLL
jgi:hypothetical protein